DFAVLSADYFSVPEDQIKRIESVLTSVDGKVVYGAGPFEHLAPPPLAVSPDWSPVAQYGGYARSENSQPAPLHHCDRSWFRALTEDARQFFAGHTPIGLPCECFVF